MCLELKAEEFYDSLKSILTNSIIGRSSWYLKDKFITVWAKYLQQQYILSKQPKDISKVMDTSPSEYEEIFLQPTAYENLNVMLHFNISVLKRLAAAQEKQNIELSIKNFTNDDGLVQYTKTKYIPALLLNNEPIIIVPYFVGTKDWLVADGNKRLTAKIMNNKPTILAYIFTQKEVIPTLSNCFEQSFYVFMAQLNLAQRCCYDNDFTEIENIFLKTLHRLSF